MTFSQNITFMTFLLTFFYLIRENYICGRINKPSKEKNRKKNTYKSNLFKKRIKLNIFTIFGLFLLSPNWKSKMLNSMKS